MIAVEHRVTVLIEAACSLFVITVRRPWLAQIEKDGWLCWVINLNLPQAAGRTAEILPHVRRTFRDLVDAHDEVSARRQTLRAIGLLNTIQHDQ